MDLLKVDVFQLSHIPLTVATYILQSLRSLPRCTNFVLRTDMLQNDPTSTAFAAMKTLVTPMLQQSLGSGKAVRMTERAQYFELSVGVRRC